MISKNRHTDPMDHTGARPPRTRLAGNHIFSGPSAALGRDRRAEKIGVTRQARGSGSHGAPQIIVRMGVPPRESWTAVSQDGGYLLFATPPLEEQACYPVIGDAPIRYRESP